MSGIIASGVGSGLDIKGLVEGLVSAQREPKQRLIDKNEFQYQAKLSAYGNLKSALSSLKDSVDLLTDGQNFKKMSAVSSDATKMSATAVTGAQIGHYDIDVVQLASANKLLSQSFSNGDTVVGEGEITVWFGDQSFSVTIDSTNSTLKGIRDAINNAPDNHDVSASLMNTDDGVQLLISSNKTGVLEPINCVMTEDAEHLGLASLQHQHAFVSSSFASATTAIGEGVLNFDVGGESFSVTIDSNHQTLTAIKDAINAASDNVGVCARIENNGGEYQLAITAKATLTISNPDKQLDSLLDSAITTNDSQLTELDPPANTQIKVEGKTISSASLHFDEFVDGVSLTLTSQALVGDTLGIEIKHNTQSIINDVKGMTTAYNELNELMSKLSAYHADSHETGPLLGDAMLQGVQSQTRSVMAKILELDNSSISALVDLGITTERNGQLSFDESILTQLLETGIDDVKAFFSDAEGFATQLAEVVDSYADFNGLVDLKTESINTSLKDIAKQRELLEMRMDKYEKRLMDQFGALDGLVAKLRNQSDFLMQQLSNMPLNNVGKK